MSNGAYLVEVIGRNIISFFSVWWGWNTFFHDVLHLPAIEQWFQVLALGMVLTAVGTAFPIVRVVKDN